MEAPGRHLDVVFKPMEETLKEPFAKDFPTFPEGLVRGEPGGFVLTPAYAEDAEELYNFHLRPDDVWVVSFPKCGTTWTQELVWLVANDADFEGAKKSLNARFPFLEIPYLYPRQPGDTEFAPYVKSEMDKRVNMHSPRFLKSHLTFDLLPKELLDTCKVVYVARNPKDTLVSYFYHHKLIKMQDFTGDVEAFANYFMEDKLLYSPFFHHVLSAWKLRDHPNLLFLFYEDLKKDLAGGIKKVAAFLGKSLSDDCVQALTRHLTFENLSRNDAVNKEDGKAAGRFHEDGRFMRKGETGDWKRHFSPELNRRLDEWIEVNLRDTGLSFVEEL